MSNDRDNKQVAQQASPASASAASAGGAATTSFVPAAVYPADHVDLGLFYLGGISSQHPEWNVYGGDINDSLNLPYLAGNLDGYTISRTRCGSFVNLLLGQAYPYLDDNGVYTGSRGIAVIYELTGSISPPAAKWHDAIASGATTSGTGKYAFANILRVDAISRGDILAAAYTGGTDNTGHVTIVASIRLSNTADPIGPAVANTRQYIVTVIDSSNSQHSNDTRAVTGTTGIGRGDMRLYEDLTTGQIAAWCWSTATTSPAFTQLQRHMVAGRLLGIPSKG